MSILTVQHLSKAYWGRPILSDLNFRLDAGERLAIIGDNGAGKSTLMRLICQLESPDEGQVQIANGVIWARLSQQMEELEDLEAKSLDDQQLQAIELNLDLVARQLEENPNDANLLRQYATLQADFDRIGGYQQKGELASILAGLGLKGEILERPLNTLSGGERMRVALAKTLLKKPDLLFLDEPTNHLDLRAIAWLEQHLNQYSGTLLFISHDRHFIDACATKVGLLLNGELSFYSGNYSQFLQQQAVEQDFARKQIERLQKEQAHEAQVAQTMLSHRKMSSYHAREKRVAKLEDQLQEAKKSLKHSYGRMSFKFVPDPMIGDPNRVILRASELALTFPDGVELFRDVHFDLKAQEKLVFVGPNGCGKSTLMHALLGEKELSQGLVRFSQSLDMAYMGQYTRFEDEEREVLEELLSRSQMGEGAARSLLARFGFREQDVFKSISVLSGGERSRLFLCCLLQEKPDLLFLDEPTNHLDIRSKTILEEALADFPGAILAISHDRYFIKKVGQRLLGFSGKTLQSYPTLASYERHLEADFRAQTSGAIRASSVPSRSNRLSSTPPSGLSDTDKASMYASASAVSSAQEKAMQSAQTSEGLSVGASEVSAGHDRLAQLKDKYKNKGLLRREKSKLQEEMRQLERDLEQLELEKEKQEAALAEASGPEPYEQYARLLAQMDELSEAYLEKGMLLEELEQLNERS